MSNRLKRTEFEHLAPDAEGESVQAHHCKEGKGNDKLYVKRIKNNGILAYCHHCGKSGYVFGNESAARFLQKEADILRGSPDGNVESGDILGVRQCRTGDGEDDRGREEQSVRGIPFHLPRDADRNLKRWSSVQAKLWVLSYGIKLSTLDHFEIYWSDSLSAIIFPQRKDGELVGYQYRKFPNPDGHPKYVTKTKDNFIRKNNYLDVLRHPIYYPGVCILVEDYISAIRIGNLGYACCPLWGNNLHDAQLTKLLQDYSKFGIMLDNDNVQVKKMQRTIASRLEAHGKEVKIFLLDKDPKEYKDEELEEILNAYRPS